MYLYLLDKALNAPTLLTVSEMMEAENSAKIESLKIFIRCAEDLLTSYKTLNKDQQVEYLKLAVKAVVEVGVVKTKYINQKAHDLAISTSDYDNATSGNLIEEFETVLAIAEQKLSKLTEDSACGVTH